MTTLPNKPYREPRALAISRLRQESRTVPGGPGTAALKQAARCNKWKVPEFRQLYCYTAKLAAAILPGEKHRKCGKKKTYNKK